MAPTALPRLAVPPVSRGSPSWQLGGLSEPRALRGARPARLRGSPGFSGEGAPSAAPSTPRPRGLEGRTKPGAGAGAGCGQRFRASPRAGPSARGCRGLNDRDAAGRAPAGAEGPGPGRWLPRAPRSRLPVVACALVGDAQVSVGAEPGARGGLGVESRVAETFIPGLSPE